jgi:hypothetical protein
MKTITGVLAAVILPWLGVRAAPTNALANSGRPALGSYFAKTKYEPAPVPKFETTRDLLPAPIYDENTNWVAMYWKSWELGFGNFHEPAPGSGYVSPFIDAAFNQSIFLWDSCFMSMFCNYAHPLVPGIGSLDNFYCKQFPDGEIPRQIERTTGMASAHWCNSEHRPLFSRWGWNLPRGSDSPTVVYRDRVPPVHPPFLTLDALDNPIFSWAEREHLRVTGDRTRIALVYEPLVHYYRALQEYLRQGNGLYLTDWASMDNSPRNPYLAKGGTAVDISCEMAMFADDLAAFAQRLGKNAEAAQFKYEFNELAAHINRLMWDPEKQFYFDLTWEGERVPVKTVAGFWPLIAGVASPNEAAALAAELQNPNTFNRQHRVPTLAADQPGYNPSGGYWRGAVWAPIETMVIRGLQRYGQDQLAADIARNHLTCMGEVFTRTGTVWENYAPDALAPGKPAKRDFVGWSAIGPIVYLLEFAIGLTPDAEANTLTWKLASPQRCGCERYRFNGHVVSLLATPDGKNWNLRVQSDGPFQLKVLAGARAKTFAVKLGDNGFAIPMPSHGGAFHSSWHGL